MLTDSRLAPVSIHARSSPSSAYQRALLDRASALKNAPSQHPQPLQGTHLGLMSASLDGEDALLFVHAAHALGARVSLLPVPAQLDEGEAANLGRVLGLLYDAVECQGMQPGTVQEISVAGQLPVFEGLAEPHHWITRLAEDWQAEAPLRDRRRWLIQAALLATLF